MGIAINGVLIIGHHHDSSTTTALTKSFDSCAGHADTLGRYHYHAAPLCILRQLHLPVPATGTDFLLTDSASEAIDCWPPTAPPSPLLGVALDGFPIMGPYDSFGSLITASSGRLDSCNFDHDTRQYHFTPDAPYGPTCLVGPSIPDAEPFSVTDSSSTSATCPSNGIDNFYCHGASCLPTYQPPCTDWIPLPLPFTPTPFFYFSVACLVFLGAFTLYAVFLKIASGVAMSPISMALISVLPAFAILVVLYFVLGAFYYDPNDPNGVSNMQEMLDSHLNDVAASYLSVVGVIYSLLIAHLLNVANDKYTVITDLFITEVAGVRQILQMLKTIKTNSSATLKEKAGAVEMILAYLDYMHVNWGEIDSAHDVKSSDILYGILPYVDRIIENSDGSNFASNISDRIIDSANEVGVAHSKRIALQNSRIPPILWSLNVILTTSMFFGISIIYTGSSLFNFVICCSGAVLIGVSTYAIADLDSPYTGQILLCKDNLDVLRDIVKVTLRDDNNALSIEIDKQTLSMRESVRMLVKSVQEGVQGSSGGWGTLRGSVIGAIGGKKGKKGKKVYYDNNGLP
jgi:hypothetical protein